MMSSYLVSFFCFFVKVFLLLWGWFFFPITVSVLFIFLLVSSDKKDCISKV